MKKRRTITMLVLLLLFFIVLFWLVLYPKNLQESVYFEEDAIKTVEKIEEYAEEQTSNEAVIEEIQQRYGEDVSLLQEKDGLFTFTKHLITPIEVDLQFYVKISNGIVNDNYYDELYRYTGEAYFAQTGRIIQWSMTESDELKSYTPILYVNTTNDDSIRAFCEEICNYVEYCCDVKPFDSDIQYLESFIFYFAGEQPVFMPESIGINYDRNQLYNETYVFIDEYFKKISSSNNYETASQEQPDELSQELIYLYLSYEPAFVYLAEDGMEYRMVEADRALGSSYFVLLGTYDNGRTCFFYNRDPFNGSGGTSTWLCFLDEKIGFAGLAYSGGNYGRLYRTEDGGESFVTIEIPSAKIKLSDGTYYNPFVMPEKVYEEDGKLYLEVGQGPNGDYYGENGFCKGLYVSGDFGITWKYSGEIPNES